MAKTRFGRGRHPVPRRLRHPVPDRQRVRRRRPLTSAFPGWLVEVQDQPKYVHDVAELIFFVVNIVVLPTAAGAVWVAMRQFQGAENARKASIYMGIAADWNSDRLVASRMYLLGLRDDFHDPTKSDCHKTAVLAGRTLDVLSKEEGTKLCQHYIELCLAEERKKDRISHNRKTAILTYFEDLGVLCRKDYVSDQDVFDLIASPIKLQTELLWSYMHSFDPSNYAHARQLYEGAVKYLAARPKP